MTSETIILRGSYGDLHVDRQTGSVLSYEDHGQLEPGELGYSDILFILPETLKPGRCACLDEHGETDILTAGFVDASGRMTNPLPWSDEDEMWIEPVALLPAPSRPFEPVTLP